MKQRQSNRRDFLKGAGAIAAASTLPVSMVELAFANPASNLTFAYISDAHIQHIRGKQLQYQLHAPPRVPAWALGRSYRADLG